MIKKTFLIIKIFIASQISFAIARIIGIWIGSCFNAIYANAYVSKRITIITISVVFLFAAGLLVLVIKTLFAVLNSLENSTLRFNRIVSIVFVVLLIIPEMMILIGPNILAGNFGNIVNFKAVNYFLNMGKYITSVSFTTFSSLFGMLMVLTSADTPEKNAIHGPNFNLPTHNDEGISVGYFRKEVFPAHVRKFIPNLEEDIKVPYNRLSRNVTILGDMGSGKSRLMYLIEEGIREKYPNIPILIHDPKGEWLRTYYNPSTDLIFAPFDKRTAHWSLWKEFEASPEILYPLISTAIEAHHKNVSDRFWIDSAINLLKDISAESNLENAKQMLLTKKEIDFGDKTFQSIYASSLVGLRDLAAIDLLAKSNEARTIEDFLNWKGRIFLLNSPVCAAEQHGALSIFLCAFLLKALSKADVNEGELQAAVLIDEALTFHLPVDVEQAVFTQSRSKGLCVVAGAQRLPNKLYNERALWGEMAGHIFTMRITDLETRKELAHRLGEIKYYDEQVSRTKVGGIFERHQDSTTMTSVHMNHAVLNPEDFGNFASREFLLFHQNGIVPGAVYNITAEQKAEIQPFCYNKRQDIVEFMRKL